jgi:hypothetical protein
MTARIQPSEIPQAIITPTSEISAGRGWAALVKAALPLGDHLEIAEISAVDGLLNIEIAGRYTSLTARHIEWARAESATICEICGDPGSLRADADWLRTRCDEHADMRVCSVENLMNTPIPAYSTEWENAVAVGREYGADWLRDDLAVREKARRAALWSLTTAKRLGKLSDELSAEERAAAAMLARIQVLDKDFPIGPAAGWTADEVKARVTPSSERHIRPEDIPEPWATRFLKASIGSTICAAGHPIDDWHNFLYLWEKENEQ